MALVIPAGTRLATAAGVPISGAQVRVRNANTVTLSDLFSDTALTVQLTNPVITNAAGYPSSNGTTATLVFAASANYDVAFLDADDNVLLPLDDVPALGSDSATFVRDYTNSRFQVRGSGGIIYVEAGDADPDDTGGTGVLGGWDGTQADSWTINAVLANIVGAFKVNSKKLSGVVLTEATAFTAVSSLDIALTESPSDIRGYEIELWDYVQSGNGSLTLRTSHDGGGTYKAGAADYLSAYGSFVTGTGAAVTAASLSTSAQLASNMNGGTNQPGRLLIRIITPESGNDATVITWRADGVNNTGAVMVIEGVVWAGATYSRASHVRLLMSPATMTGKYAVRTLYGLGDA